MHIIIRYTVAINILRLTGDLLYILEGVYCMSDLLLLVKMYMNVFLNSCCVFDLLIPINCACMKSIIDTLDQCSTVCKYIWN